jgi:hypothetical protein
VGRSNPSSRLSVSQSQNVRILDQSVDEDILASEDVKTTEGFLEKVWPLSEKGCDKGKPDAKPNPDAYDAYERKNG